MRSKITVRVQLLPPVIDHSPRARGWNFCHELSSNKFLREFITLSKPTLSKWVSLSLTKPSEACHGACGYYALGEMRKERNVWVRAPLMRPQ